MGHRGRGVERQLQRAGRLESILELTASQEIQDERPLGFPRGLSLTVELNRIELSTS
jgi:hypothetical protein